MNVVEVGDVVQVEARFGSGGIEPVAFVWQRRRIVAEKLNAFWRDDEGDCPVLYFSVSANGAVYELAFDAGALLWRLMRVATVD